MSTIRPILEMGRWRTLKVSKKERENGAMLSPEGHWYNVPFGDHFLFAWYVLKDLDGMTDKQFREFDLYKAVDLLIEKHYWIHIYHAPLSGTIIHGTMNEQQFKALYEFFGDAPLFRGWTIKALYDERRAT